MNKSKPDPLEVERLFSLISELAPEGWKAALKEESVDPNVIRRVELLLNRFHDPTSLFEQSVNLPRQVESLVRPEFVGPYRVCDVLGSGGMGVVYLAEQEKPSRQVAVKVMHAGLSLGQHAMRFEREAELLGRLQHKGIAQIFESGSTGDGHTASAYIVMEYIDGQPISKYVKSKKLSRDAIIQLMIELAEAVHHAHLRGVLHRDLKPNNILVDRHGQVKVIDFGVARALDREEQATLETMAGQIVGTLAYMSPEQVRGEVNDIDARSDVYALGVIAFELFSGQLPHDIRDLSITQAAAVLTTGEPARLGMFNSSCKGDLELIINLALEKESSRRYQSAAALAADFQRFLDSKPIEARAPSAYYQLSKIARRNRILFAGIAATLLAILAGGGVATHLAIKNSRLAADNGILAEKEKEARIKANDEAAESLRLRDLAEERALQVVLRSDPDRLVMTKRGAKELWPATPASTKAIETWLNERAYPLRDNMALHEFELEKLHERALPWSDTEREHDRENHPNLARLNSLKEALADCDEEIATKIPDLPFAQLVRERLIEKRNNYSTIIAELETIVAQRWTWSFDDPDDLEWHGRLRSFIRSANAFLKPKTGEVALVENRLEEANSLAARSFELPIPAAEWATALADMQTGVHYGELEFAPQLGLRPLRRDPISGLWEFWHLATGERPVLSTDPEAITCWDLQPQTAVIFILCPGGDVTLGSQAEDPDGLNYDPDANITRAPLYEAHIEPFFISKYEMTIDQWRRFTGESPSVTNARFVWYGEPASETAVHRNTLINPVENMTGPDAEEVMRQLALRLPSSSEWEYAARAGTETPWWTGPDIASLRSSSTANLADQRTKRLGGPGHFSYEDDFEDLFAVHSPVGTFPPNPFGLHDTIGNLWEWCSDLQPGGLNRLVRGGSYSGNALLSRSSEVNYHVQLNHSSNIGFRPARSLD